MLHKGLICALIILAFAFSQGLYVSKGDVRLSPRMLNYQGYLTDTLGIPITNPSMSMSFTIFDAVSAGNQKWSESQSIGVSKGIFHVLLGSITSIPDTVFTAGTNRWLQLTVAGQVLTPRTRITSSGYAYTSIYSDTAQYARSFSAHDHLGESWTTTAVNRALLMKIDRNTSSNINGLVDSVLNAGTGAGYGGQFFSGGTGTGLKGGIAATVVVPSGSGNPGYGAFCTSSHNGTGYAFGGYFAGSGTGTGTKYGVYADAYAPSGSSNSSCGTCGNSDHGGTGVGYGGYFYSGGSGTGIKYGLYCNALASSSNPAYGTYAYSTQTGSGADYGYYGLSNQNGSGVSFGGYFVGSGSSTNTKFGMLGEAVLPSGSSNPGFGVYGTCNHAGSGLTYGGYFIGAGSGTYTKYGVYGEAVAPSGSSYGGYGVYGYSDHSGSGVSSGGYFYGGGSGTGVKYGVIANAYASASDTNPSYGMNANSSHAGSGASYGTYSYSTHTGTGNNYGVYGYSNQNGSDTSFGGYFSGRGSSLNTKYGIYAQAVGYSGSSYPVYGCWGESNHAGSGNAFGCRGESYHTGSGNTYGGFFYAVSSGNGTAYGLTGLGDANGTGYSYGGYFEAGGTGTVAYKCGVYATTYGSATVLWAGFFAGNLGCTGTKSAAVKINEGDWRLLYCQESPELWFEDFGEGQLQNGRAHIELETIYLKTVTITTDHPMKVFVQLADDCNGVFVQRGKTGFDVIELQNGTSNASFTYRVVAKRQGYENLRLKKMEPGFRPDERRAENEKIQQERGKRRVN